MGISFLWLAVAPNSVTLNMLISSCYSDLHMVGNSCNNSHRLTSSKHIVKNLLEC